ncbi:MAG TPA: FAD:protein FMN transferase [Gemmatimonadetes bacterium]|nr:FAD:protein FMN transferase [Gemmatimonadota bacterium]
MSDTSSQGKPGQQPRRLPRRQALRITAAVGASALLGGGLLRSALERVGLRRVRETRDQMGTLVTISAVHPDPDVARMMVADTFDEIERMEGLLSRHRKGTPVWRLNEFGVLRAPPHEVLEVVGKALEYSELTSGAFDVTVAPLLNLYNASFSETGVAPPSEEIRRALALVGSRHVHVSDREIVFEKVGMAVTLDGIAKGYIVDRAVEVLQDHGAERVLVNAGGDMASAGESLGGEAWQIGLQDPRIVNGSLGVVRLRGESVASSGDYMQYLTPDMSVHHILDPRTGSSPEHTSGVSVVAPSAMTADALSTAALVLGPREGMELLDRLDGIEGMIVTKDQTILRSKGLGRYTV